MNIYRVDPRRSLLADDRPPNEFSFQHDQIIINLDEPVPLTDPSMNSPFDLLQRITTIIKRLFEIKRADKVQRENLRRVYPQLLFPLEFLSQ